MDLKNINIDFYIDQLDKKEECSELGFFSKPYKVKIDGVEVIFKRYHPTSKNISDIIALHDQYIESLRRMAINVPSTRMIAKTIGSKQELIICQKAFQEDELLRTNFSKKSFEDLCQYLTLLFDEMINFWNKNHSTDKMGFHPTLRNYAIRANKLYYFDTFPPMNMSQTNLNKLILQMAPIPDWVKVLVPIKSMNRVSNEYYFFDKMFLGVLGSSIRLRPELGHEILAFTKIYLSTCDLSAEMKNQLLEKVKLPPKLPFVWRLIRKLTGNIGQPNARLSNKKQTSL